jgi:hypothetical protein
MLSPEYVKAIEEWLTYYNEHATQTQGRGVEQRLQFLEKAVRGCFIILSGLTYEVERVDIGKGRASERRLVLPVSFR